MVIRLAAIDAIRRVPCHLNGRSSVLSLYLDTKQNTELRIGAYLAAMQCPSAQLLEEVKQALTHENINQVGSFVWTHLTNLQESSSPSKQAVRQLLANEFLRNKFNTDARKFSRNLEASSYWQDLNVGGTVESNIRDELTAEAAADDFAINLSSAVSVTMRRRRTEPMTAASPQVRKTK